MQLRALVGSEDSYDLCLGPLHRIIVELSSADLQTQVDLEPSRIDDRDWKGCTPLMWSALRNNPTYLKILLSQGARVDLKDSDGRTAIHHAARVGSVECVRALLKAGTNPSIADNRSMTPLHDVAYDLHNSGIGDTIKLLHSHAASLEARDPDGKTPLYLSVDMGFHAAVVVLVECGADVNAPDLQDIPPVGRAIMRGNHDIVHRLCQSDIESSWNPLDHGVKSVLHEAALHGTVKVMDVLANSTMAPVECHLAKLEYWFNNYRQVFGERCSDEEELAAFHRLLSKKAVPMQPHFSDLPATSNDALDEEEAVNDKEFDVFADAVEHLSLLDQSSALAIPSTAV
jgi:ankyrin repeat protein